MKLYFFDVLWREVSVTSHRRIGWSAHRPQPDNTAGDGSQWQGHAIGLSRTFTILTIAYAIISDM